MLATMVTSRTREIGVRVAIGANRHDIARIVLMRAAALLFGGAAIGSIVAMTAWHVVNTSDAGHELLFGVHWADARLLGSFIPVLALVAIFRCAVPTWRAVRIDPVRALRMSDE
jgi:ABC-type antimicrobial peptide transport system permease subunit